MLCPVLEVCLQNNIDFWYRKMCLCCGFNLKRISFLASVKTWNESCKSSSPCCDKSFWNYKKHFFKNIYLKKNLQVNSYRKSSNCNLVHWIINALQHDQHTIQRLLELFGTWAVVAESQEIFQQKLILCDPLYWFQQIRS